MGSLGLNDLPPIDRDTLLGRSDALDTVSPAVESAILSRGSESLLFDAAMSHHVSEEFLAGLHRRFRGVGLETVIATNPNAPLELMGEVPIAHHSDFSIRRYVERRSSGQFPDGLSRYLLEEHRMDATPLRIVVGAALESIG